MVCLKCEDNGKVHKLAYHQSTSTMINHLRHQHNIEQQGPKGVGTFPFPHPKPSSPTDQPKINSFRALSATGGKELSATEYIAAIWARNNQNPHAYSPIVGEAVPEELLGGSVLPGQCAEPQVRPGSVVLGRPQQAVRVLCGKELQPLGARAQ